MVYMIFRSTISSSNFFSIFIFSFSLILVQEISAQATLKIEEVLTIESNETGKNSDAPIIGFISQVATNSKGQIFIFDSRQSKFHVYDNSGSWLRSFGQLGSGPGDFGQISTIYIDNYDRLLVADRENARISIFNSEGQLLDTKLIQGINTIRSIRQMPDDKYLISGVARENLVHILDESLQDIESSFITTDEFTEVEEEQKLQWIRSQSGKAHPINDSLIVFTPFNYQGRLFLYRKDEAGKWNLVDKIHGYESFNPALTFYSKPPKDIPVHGIMTQNSNLLMISSHTMSYGFYTSQDNNLIHISYLTSQKTMKLVVENFAPLSKTLKNYGLTDSLNIELSIRKQPLWLDSNNQLYLTDNSHIPKLRVLKFHFKN